MSVSFEDWHSNKVQDNRNTDFYTDFSALCSRFSVGPYPQIVRLFIYFASDVVVVLTSHHHPLLDEERVKHLLLS